MKPLLWSRLDQFLSDVQKVTAAVVHFQDEVCHFPCTVPEASLKARFCSVAVMLYQSTASPSFNLRITILPIQVRRDRSECLVRTLHSYFEPECIELTGYFAEFPTLQLNPGKVPIAQGFPGFQTEILTVFQQKSKHDNLFMLLRFNSIEEWTYRSRVTVGLEWPRTSERDFISKSTSTHLVANVWRKV